MSKKNSDNIFQLSLTEIALILAFLILLLLGLITYKATTKEKQTAKNLAESQQKISEYQASESYIKLIENYENLKNNIEKYLLNNSIPDSTKILDDLVSISKLQNTIDELKIKFSETQASEQACKTLEARFAKDGAIDPIKLAEAIELQSRLENLLSDLRKQGVTFDKPSDFIQQGMDNVNELKRVKKMCGGGAIGPCWVDSNMRTENLLKIILEPNFIRVEPAEMSSERKRQMTELPGIELATRNQIPYEDLERSFGPILSWSKSRNPECRHYALIQSTIPLTKDSTPRRIQVQKYFFPDESVSK